MNEEDQEENSLAKESPQTRRAREKLKKQFEEQKTKITPEALKEKSIEIHRWIARHAKHRISLKNKNISLFDENQNAAKLSSRIKTFADRLKENLKEMPDSIKTMRVAEKVLSEQSKK